MSSRAFFGSAWHLLQLLILLLDAAGDARATFLRATLTDAPPHCAVAGIATSAVSPSTLTFFNPMLRPLLFVAYSSRVRRAFGSFIAAIPAVASVVGLVLMHLIFFAVRRPPTCR